ncbi:mediator complex subunit, partial [Mortierella sp. AD031]
PPTLLDNLSAEQKQSVKEQMSQMMPMFMKLDQLMPIFFAMTGNLDATARLVLLKFMFQDQLDAMEHEEYTISPGNLVRLKEELQHYFMWVKSEMMGTHPQGGQGAAPQPEVKAEPQEETFQHAA